MSEKGCILVITGPSGVGKDTIMNNLTHISDGEYSKLPTYTTRMPRPGERDGVHYHFIGKDKYDQMRADNEFIDCVKYPEGSGFVYYGLRREDLFKTLVDGKSVYLHLVYPTAFKVKSLIPDTIMIFILPPSQKEQIGRLKARGMTDEEITARLKADPNQTTSVIISYDLVLVNHDNEEEEAARRILKFAAEMKERQATGSIHASIKAGKLTLDNLLIPEYFVTTNDNKLREVKEMLGGIDIQKYQPEKVIYEPQAIDIMEVISEKAFQAFRDTGKVVLVEDTSLSFDAWNGLPGALIKWFLDAVGVAGIIKMMRGEENRKATATTVFAFFDADGLHHYPGIIEGSISQEPRGNDGFGWDSIFVPAGLDKTFAEMSSAEKNECSMRRMALDLLRKGIGTGLR